MSRIDTPRPILGSMLDLLVFLMAFSLAQLAILSPVMAPALGLPVLPPIVGIPLGLAIVLGTVHFYVLRPPFAAPGSLPCTAPIGQRVGPLAVLSAAFLVGVWGLSELYMQLVPVPEAQLNPFGPFLETAGGRLMVTLLAVGVAPFFEELFFRGLIQRRLGIRFGPAAGIAAAALVFALVHGLPWVLPLHFVLGVAFGMAVYVTGTVWTGVLLHAANNVMAVIGLTMIEAPAAAPPTPDAGAEVAMVVPVTSALAGAAVFVLVLRRMGRGAENATNATNETNETNEELP